MGRKLAAEVLGSLLLAATVIGSGIMAERLAGRNLAVASLANTAATVAALIAFFAPVSGARFNPAVSAVMALRGRMPLPAGAAYAAAQVIGCCVGALLAHAMFALPLAQSSGHLRTGAAQWLAEFVATFGLLLVVLGHERPRDAP
ncbi:MAG TPA: aquaporin [Steroidobacteraceae bacterium]|jgi:glycerol uptake facilitator-like aquaporin